MRQLAHLGRFAFADKGARVRGFEPLTNDASHSRAGAFSQSFEFVERFFGADSRLGAEFDPDQDGAFVMLVGNVVGLSQILTSIAETYLRLYQIPAIPGTAPLLPRPLLHGRGGRPHSGR
jgi:hypothetical protein